MVTCPACGLRFEPRERPQRVRRPSEVVEVPAGVRMDHGLPGELTLSWPLSRAVGIVWTLAAAVLVLFVVSRPRDIAAWVVFLPLAGVVGYVGVAHLLGRIVLHAGPDVITRRVHPVPLRRAEVPRRGITEITVREVLGTQRRRDWVIVARYGDDPIEVIATLAPVERATFVAAHLAHAHALSPERDDDRVNA